MAVAAAVRGQQASRLDQLLDWAAPKLERLIEAASPGWALIRSRARAAVSAVRHYEAAATGRRTEGWKRNSLDANAANRPALGRLRDLARDLYRNNGWAKRGVNVICNNTVGWGIQAAPADGTAKNRAKRASAAWTAWSESTDCDAGGLLTFGGLQRLVLKTVVKAGECLVIRKWRTDGLGSLPVQLRVLEPDYIDIYRDGVQLQGGGRIVQGVEFDANGKRVAYWLHAEHPGAMFQVIGRLAGTSIRVPAEDVLHIFLQERPGQVRGVSWLAPAIVAIQDLDEYESAALMKQKIAACFSAFVVDRSGTMPAVSKQSDSDPLLETLEPGTISYLGPDREITFASPPGENSYDAFTKAQQRRVAAGMGVTYEDLTGDYANTSFSASRMSRLSHWANVYTWQWLMVIPMLCDPVWRWAMQGAIVAGKLDAMVAATWSPPPMPMIEPDREGLAYARLIRSGVKTLADAVREQGKDFATHIAEYMACNDALDAAGIWLDSDPRRTSAAGLTQERAGGGGGGGVGQAAQLKEALGGDGE